MCLGEGYKPKMAVVVVQKRISIRIFGKGSNGYLLRSLQEIDGE